MTNSDELTEIIRQWMDVFATRSMHDWSHYVKTTGLSMPQFGILMHLHYREHCGVSHISERMEISAAAASQLVDRLVNSGLVERIEDPVDRRAKQLTLSQKGRALIETGIAERSRWVGELVASMTPEEYEVVAAALSTLTHSANRLEQSKATG